MRHSSKGEQGRRDRGLLNEEKTSFNSLFLNQSLLFCENTALCYNEIHCMKEDNSHEDR